MDDLNWKILDEEDLYQNERGMRVFRQKLSLPDGKIIDDFYQIEIKSFVTMVIQDEEQNFLCFRQYKHGMRRVALTLPGGMIDPGEVPLETAARELLEETGYECENIEHMGGFVLNGNHHICDSHIVRGQGARKIAEPTEPDQENPVLCLLSPVEIKTAFFEGEFPIISHVAALGMVLSK